MTKSTQIVVLEEENIETTTQEIISMETTISSVIQEDFTEKVESITDENIFITTTDQPTEEIQTESLSEVDLQILHQFECEYCD